MPELRVIAVNEDGTHLVLKSADGQKHTLPIDERLRAAVRGDRARLGQIQVETDSQLRPRDIQARIRSGMTAEEVARLAGVSVDRVRRFEGPVLAERAYMAERAQKATVRRRSEEAGGSGPGSGSAGPGPLLGEIAAEHLKRRGVEADSAHWDSWRREDGRWEIVLTFTVGARTATARWSFDPPLRVAVPDDDEARSLSSDEPDRPEPTFPFVPRIAAVSDRRPSGEDRVDAADDGEPANGEDDLGEDDLLALANQAGSTRPGESRRPKPDADRSDGPERRTDPRRAAPTIPPVARVGADRRPGTAFDDAMFSSPAVPAGAETERAVEPHHERLTGRTDQQAEADGVRPGRRATVPSWDEIVFGSRRGTRRDQ